ncbi:hypothetical protein EZS27_014860 [termite gut metagenome]|uniref:Uncharacterized protein n=1 Tax=termite gut metagenome TaxID=433724 RepID=A0A5J4RUB2_9ZZZZ
MKNFKNLKFVISLFFVILNVSCETKKNVDEISTEPVDTRLNVTTRLSNDNQPVVPYFTLKNETTSKKVTYTFKNGMWEANSDPFVMQDVSIGNKLVAEYEPLNADPISNIKDILQSEIIYNGEKNIEFNFSHINSRFVFKLVNNTNKIFKKISVNLWDNFTIKDFENEYSVIISPQTIKKGSIIKITVDDENFNFSLEKDLTLDKNSVLFYTLRLNNELSIGEINEAEWKVENVVNSIIVPTINKIQLLEDGIFSFIIENDKTGIKKNFSFNYIHDENKLAEILSSVDESFDWNIFSETDTYTLFGKFVPNREGNPEKDILEETTHISWGKPISFNNFNHINSTIEIEFKDMDNQYFNTQNNYIVLNGFNFSNSLKEYKVPLEKNIIITMNPQILTNESTIKLILEGEEFNSRLNLTKVGEINLTEFEAGKKYVLKYSIHYYENNKNFTISYTISDWKITNGTGEFFKN